VASGKIADHRGFSAAVAELQVTLRDLAFAFARIRARLQARRRAAY
jgi:hypothetical protein